MFRRISGLMRLSMLILCFTMFFVGCQRGGTDGVSGSIHKTEDLLKGITTVQEPDTAESLAEKKAKVESNLKQANDLLAAGQKDESIALLESSLTLDAKHREVLFRLVELLRTRSREVVESDPGRAYRLMVQAGGYLHALKRNFNEFSADEKQLFATVLFDEACAHARSKRREEFSGAFGEAMDEGFTDLERLKNDPDLAEFRTVPEMKDIIDKAIDRLTTRK